MARRGSEWRGPMLRGVVWVFVFGGIALAGLVMLIAYAVWLAHKASDVMSEVQVLAERGDQLAGLLAQIQVPELSPAGPRTAQRPHSGRGARLGRADVGWQAIARLTRPKEEP